MNIMSVTAIVREMGCGASGHQRALVQADLDSGLEKLWSGLKLEVGPDGAALVMFRLYAMCDPFVHPPLWLIAELARHLVLPDEEPMCHPLPRGRRPDRDLTARQFVRHLRAEAGTKHIGYR